MSTRNLVERIIDLLKASSFPLSTADVRRRLIGDVGRDEISSRLTKMAKRAQVITGQKPSDSITGPRMVTVYALPGTAAAKELEALPDIAQTQQIGEIASRQVASAVSADDKAA